MVSEAWAVNQQNAARIRRMYDDGASIYALALDTGLSMPTITRILDNHAYTPVPGPLLPSGLPATYRPEFQPCNSDCALVYERNMAASARTWRWRTEAAD